MDQRCDDIGALARAVRTHFTLALGTGIVVANPIPVEHELPADVYERALATALAESRSAGTRGRAVTRETLHQFIRTLPIPEPARRELLALTPATYLGLAEDLALRC